MWNILPSEDETMIAESVRQFLDAELPLERLRPKPVKLVDWNTLRAEMAHLGWFGVSLPETCGGSGLGIVEEMLIQREFGRAVASLRRSASSSRAMSASPRTMRNWHAILLPAPARSAWR